MFNRRDYLRTAGALAVGATLAGCTGQQGNGGQDGGEPSPTPTETATETETETATPGRGVTDVAVGPEKRLRFVPDEIDISVGETVRWTAESEGHNVTSHPDASPKCENPEGAEPFKSYEGESHFSVMEVGATFEHEFTVAGTYVYVCAPHAGQGMVGTVNVSE